MGHMIEIHHLNLCCPRTTRFDQSLNKCRPILYYHIIFILFQTIAAQEKVNMNDEMLVQGRDHFYYIH